MSEASATRCVGPPGRLRRERVRARAAVVEQAGDAAHGVVDPVRVLLAAAPQRVGLREDALELDARGVVLRPVEARRVEAHRRPGDQPADGRPPSAAPRRRGRAAGGGRARRAACQTSSATSPPASAAGTDSRRKRRAADAQRRVELRPQRGHGPAPPSETVRTTPTRLMRRGSTATRTGAFVTSARSPQSASGT